MANLLPGSRDQRRGHRVHRLIRIPRRTTRRAVAARQNNSLRNWGERLVAEQLKRLGLTYRYEEVEYTTDLPLNGRPALGYQTFRPDFSVAGWGVCFEVTLGKSRAHKDIKMAMIRSVKRLHGVTVILVGPSTLARLETGKVTLWDLVPESLRENLPRPSVDQLELSAV